MPPQAWTERVIALTFSRNAPFTHWEYAAKPGSYRSRAMARPRFRTIFISDVHLGLRDCQAAYLLDFLRGTSCEHLYLVGDILDIENLQLTPFWHSLHGEVVAEILGIAARGTRVTYIPGNHDAVLRRFAGQRFAGVDIALDAVHVAADGRRYRVSHGDEHDSESAAPAWLLKLGDVMQGFV